MNKSYYNLHRIIEVFFKRMVNVMVAFKTLNNYRYMLTLVYFKQLPAVVMPETAV